MKLSTKDNFESLLNNNGTSKIINLLKQRYIYHEEIRENGFLLATSPSHEKLDEYISPSKEEMTSLILDNLTFISYISQSLEKSYLALPNKYDFKTALQKHSFYQVFANTYFEKLTESTFLIVKNHSEAFSESIRFFFNKKQPLNIPFSFLKQSGGGLKNGYLSALQTCINKEFTSLNEESFKNHQFEKVNYGFVQCAFASSFMKQNFFNDNSTYSEKFGNLVSYLDFLHKDKNKLQTFIQQLSIQNYGFGPSLNDSGITAILEMILSKNKDTDILHMAFIKMFERDCTNTYASISTSTQRYQRFFGEEYALDKTITPSSFHSLEFYKSLVFQIIDTDFLSVMDNKEVKTLVILGSLLAPSMNEEELNQWINVAKKLNFNFFGNIEDIEKTEFSFVRDVTTAYLINALITDTYTINYSDRHLGDEQALENSYISAFCQNDLHILQQFNPFLTYQHYIFKAHGNHEFVQNKFQDKIFRKTLAITNNAGISFSEFIEQNEETILHTICNYQTKIKFNISSINPSCYDTHIDNQVAFTKKEFKDFSIILSLLYYKDRMNQSNSQSVIDLNDFDKSFLLSCHDIMAFESPNEGECNYGYLLIKLRKFIEENQVTENVLHSIENLQATLQNHIAQISSFKHLGHAFIEHDELPYLTLLLNQNMGVTSIHSLTNSIKNDGFISQSDIHLKKTLFEKFLELQSPEDSPPPPAFKIKKF